MNTAKTHLHRADRPRRRPGRPHQPQLLRRPRDPDPRLPVTTTDPNARFGG